MTEPALAPQVVLVATHDDWTGRSIASVLERDGYTVLRADVGRRALELARRVSPDAILLDDGLADISGLEVCRALRDDPLFDHAIPIFITSSAPVAHVVRRGAYRSGAWDFCTQPLDVEALVAKLRTFTRARRELVQARSELLVDPVTRLYSALGLHQLAEHLGALAIRRHAAFACVAVMPNAGLPEGAWRTDEPSPEVLTYLADICREHSRRSDVVGYLGKWQFVILAPETDALGVIGLVARLRTALGKAFLPSAPGRSTAPLHAGYWAVPDFAETSLAPDELLRRAGAALGHARGSGQLEGAFNFDEMPVS